MTLTKTQTEELVILYLSSDNDLKSGINGVAKVCKKVQLYLGCSFEEAVETLQIIQNTVESSIDYLLSK